jgi:D-amino-acid dehydrogenase
VISGSARSRDVIHAFGHGHVGLATAPATADLVAALVLGTAPDPSPFTATRFRL